MLRPPLRVRIWESGDTVLISTRNSGFAATAALLKARSVALLDWVRPGSALECGARVP